MNNFKVFSKYIVKNEVDLSLLKKTTVIAHFYYFDKITGNFDYLRKIDCNIDIFIVTSNDLVESEVNKLISKYNKTNIKIIKKLNRGRDYSALFVACKEIISKYEYVCFVHDKKSHYGDDKDLGNKWETCLLENTIASNEFVLNVINCFKENKDVGILSSPLPPEEYLLGLRGKSWINNEKNTVNLLSKLNVFSNIKYDEDAYTLGSCFWFRRIALDKIINFNFKYDDFPEEPMPYDGSLAHAIERCLSYISSYEGYNNFYVLNDEYSEYYLSLVNDQLTKSISILRETNMLCFKDNKTDLDLTLQYSTNIKKYSKLIDYCIHFRRIYVIKDNSDKALKCLKELENNKIEIEEVYDVDSINFKVITGLPYGIVVCIGDSSMINLDNFNIKSGIKPYIYEE